MTTYRYLAASCAAALALIAAGGPASAASNSMPGSACQASSDGATSLLFRLKSEIRNGDDAAIAITCPVERHLSRIVSAEVMLIDRNPITASDISCTLETFNRDGTVRSANTQKSVSSFEVALPITFPGQLAPIGGGYYGLRCVLPADVPGREASSIVGYTIVEQ